MQKMISISRNELSEIICRLKKLMMEKSNLQLIKRLTDQLSITPGFEEIVDHMLRIILEYIGGSNIIVYCSIGNEYYYADVLGEKAKLDRIDDALVQRVFKNRQFIEYEHDFRDTRMLIPKFAKAFTWVFPLLAGADIVGVLKIEGLFIGVRGLQQNLQTFFNYVALLLKNEISGYTKAKRAEEWLQLVLEESAEAVKAPNEHLEGRTPKYTAEYRALSKSGKGQWIPDRGKAAKRDRQGRLLRVVGMASVIKKYKQTEEELRKSKECFLNLIEASPVAEILLSGLDGQLNLVNRKFTELFGYTIDDMPDIAHWLPLPYPDKKHREAIKGEKTKKSGKTGSLDRLPAKAKTLNENKNQKKRREKNCLFANHPTGFPCSLWQ